MSAPCYDGRAERGECEECHAENVLRVSMAAEPDSLSVCYDCYLTTHVRWARQQAAKNWRRLTRKRTT